jgi:hypothetical protein
MPPADSAAVVIPALLTALSLLGLVLKWLIQREATTDTQTLERISKLESEVELLRADQSEQRRLKHEALNRAAGLSLAARMLLTSARHCTCGALTHVVELVDRTGVMEGEHGR